MAITRTQGENLPMQEIGVDESLSGILTNIKNRGNKPVRNRTPDVLTDNKLIDLSDASSANEQDSPKNRDNSIYTMDFSRVSQDWHRAAVKTDLSCSGHSLYIYLGFNCDHSSGRINGLFSVRHINKACGLSLGNVSKTYNELIEKGFLENSDNPISQGNLLYRQSEDHDEETYNMIFSKITPQWHKRAVETKLSRSGYTVYIWGGFNCDEAGKLKSGTTTSLIAEACGISVRSVQRAFSELEQKGFFEFSGKSTIEGRFFLR